MTKFGVVKIVIALFLVLNSLLVLRQWNANCSYPYGWWNLINSCLITYEM